MQAARANCLLLSRLQIRALNWINELADMNVLNPLKGERIFPPNKQSKQRIVAALSRPSTIIKCCNFCHLQLSKCAQLPPAALFSAHELVINRRGSWRQFKAH